MAIDFSNICLTREVLAIPSAVLSPEAGAVLDFLGVVRGNENGKSIAGLNYEVYAEMALEKLRLVAKETAEKYDLQQVILLHRTGFVAVGEASLFLRVASSHREAAFLASREIIERLKQEVPIWKNPVSLPL